MGNGVIFDAEFYAQNNSDVVAALGTSEKALYKHYLEFGRTEGRLLDRDGKPVISAITNG